MKDVLLVEDNPADVYLIRMALQECGHDIHLTIVSNGRDALTFLRREGPYAREPTPTLILLDLNLPKLPGHAVLAELRRLPAYQATPLVVFSGLNKEEEPRCRQLGASAYVQKAMTYDGYVEAFKDIVQNWLTHGGGAQ